MLFEVSFIRIVCSNEKRFKESLLQDTQGFLSYTNRSLPQLRGDKLGVGGIE